MRNRGRPAENRRKNFFPGVSPAQKCDQDKNVSQLWLFDARCGVEKQGDTLKHHEYL